MNKGCLLDVHTLLWFDTGPKRLPHTVLSTLRQRERRVYVSSISAWELTIKYRIGKLPEAGPLLNTYYQTLTAYGFLELPFTTAHALKDRELSHNHKDPFDRALVAQALSEQLAIVSADPQLAAFSEVVVVWG